MKAHFYNLHDILTIRLCCEEASNVGYFDRRLRYFKSAECQNCDINIYFNISHENNLPEALKSRTLIRDTGRRRLGKWQVCIKLCGKNRFEIFFDGNWFSLKYLFYNFLEPIINYVLMSKGYCLVHASCFSREDKAFIVHGYPSSGKTSILLRALKRSSDYLSDEMTIISNSGVAYAYPTPLNFCDYNFKKDMAVKLRWSQIIKKHFSKMLRIASDGKIKPTIEVRPELLLNGGAIVGRRKVDVSCVIADADGDLTETAQNILRINQCQYKYFNNILDRDMKENADSELNGYWKNMLEVIKDFCSQVNPVVIRKEQDFEKATGIYESK